MKGELITLVPNASFDMEKLADLLSDRDEMHLVWPDAIYPFNPEQWEQRFSERPNNLSYFIARHDETIGHVALLETEEPDVFAVSFLFVQAADRGQGYGREIMKLIEAEARQKFGAVALRLRVRTYNSHAAKLYEACGFHLSEQDGTLMILRKVLVQ